VNGNAGLHEAITVDFKVQRGYRDCGSHRELQDLNVDQFEILVGNRAVFVH